MPRAPCPVPGYWLLGALQAGARLGVSDARVSEVRSELLASHTLRYGACTPHTLSRLVDAGEWVCFPVGLIFVVLAGWVVGARGCRAANTLEL